MIIKIENLCFSCINFNTTKIVLFYNMYCIEIIKLWKFIFSLKKKEILTDDAIMESLPNEDKGKNENKDNTGALRIRVRV